MQARTQKMSSMFVRCPHRYTYMHARTHLFFCYEHRHFIHMLWREKRRREGGKERDEAKDMEEKKAVVLSFAFARSVSYPVLHCGVAQGATATRSIVIALPFSHHHQQAVAAIATESERDRERNAPARVCVCGSSTTSNVVLVVSRVYADSRFFIVVVVVVVIYIEVNHECHQ